MRPIFVEPMDATILSLTAEDPAFEASNLLDRQPSVMARAAPGAADVVIDIDLGLARFVDTVALLFHTESAGATLALKGAASQAALDGAAVLATADIFAGTTDPGFGTRHGLLWFAGATHRYWRLTITGRANQDFEAGRLVLGAAFRPSKSIGYGYMPTREDGGAVRLGAYGKRNSDPGPVRAGATMTFEVMTGDDFYGQLLPLLTRLGNTRELLMVVDPEDLEDREQQLVYGDMIRSTPAQRTATRWKVKMILQGL